MGAATEKRGRKAKGKGRGRKDPQRAGKNWGARRLMRGGGDGGHRITPFGKS